MENGRYTINELSVITGFTTRTLRNYMKRGVLSGTLENGKWYFEHHHLEDFYSEPLVKEAVASKQESYIRQFLENRCRTEEEGCFIYDMPESMEQITEVMNRFTTYMKENSLKRFQFYFYYMEKKQLGRFVFIGNIEISQYRSIAV